MQTTTIQLTNVVTKTEETWTAFIPETDADWDALLGDKTPATDAPAPAAPAAPAADPAETAIPWQRNQPARAAFDPFNSAAWLRR